MLLQCGNSTLLVGSGDLKERHIRDKVNGHLFGRVESALGGLHRVHRIDNGLI
jgi:hypothetical protein